jgi:uracil phosphoribosyltransferase
MPVQQVRHALIDHYLSRLRDRHTPPDEFRAASDKMITLLLYEATRDLKLRAMPIETPLETVQGWAIDEKVVAVPILRAGLGLMAPVLALLPEVTVGYIGLERDERTAVASQYYCKLPPDMEGKTVLLLDPMLATGGSARMAIDMLKERRPASIRKICVVAAPEGIAVLAKHHPDVIIYTAAIDRQLNAQKYILPGLGDYGDRLFGT